MNSILFAVFILLSCLPATNVFGQGDLLITPKRVVFEGKQRAQEINLANIGKDTAVYAISFVNYKMKEDGSFEKIDKPDSILQTANPYLRFFPRMVTLAPNEAQTVKLQLSNTNSLLPGEYRSHLYFRAVPKVSALGEKVERQDTAIAIKLIPIFGISIPTIIRIGENQTNVTFSNTSFKMEKDTIPVVSLMFNRTGNMSSYGDVAVDYTSLQGKTTRVGIVKGIAVYTPTPLRKFRLKLDKLEGVDYTKGKLRIRYSDQSPKPKTLAEGEIMLNTPGVLSEATSGLK